MGAIFVEGLSKAFAHMHADRPMTLQEVFQRGIGRPKPANVFWALDDVSFRVGPGRIMGVIGFNGAGKSTLLRLIAGVGRPNRGRVEVRGRMRAMLDLGTGFHPELTGRENIFVSGVTSGLTRREVAERYDEIVDFSELEAIALDDPLRTYSTGMHMRLAFSVASSFQPDILLVDEVLAVGDLRFQKKCFDRMDRFRAQGGTGLFATHAPELVARLCDEAIWLHEGRVAAHGSAGEVARAYLEAADFAEVEPASAEA